MPGAVPFIDSPCNVEGDLLGTLIVTGSSRILTAVTPLTGTTTGTWIEVKKYDKICLSLICDTSATMIVCGSMAVAKPDNTTYHGYSLFGTKVYAAAAEEILSIKTPLHWLKVRVTANGGLVSAPFIGI